LIAYQIVKLTSDFSAKVAHLKFQTPVSYVYNPLKYAWKSHELYLRKYAANTKKVIFLGMNPGPFGMAQTGVPFGEIATVRNWLNIETEIGKPVKEHPKRRIEGFKCHKSEVSGRRLWGYFSEVFNTAEEFFQDHFVANFCPLVFMEESGRNRTPDRLPRQEKDLLFNLCDKYLADCIEILKPDWLIGIGRFAEQCANRALQGTAVKIGHILHPSPASPAANKGWAEEAEVQLANLGILPSKSTGTNIHQ
jgi:single-strand selective monofunctional uracil DNA glycosylase